MDEDQLQELYDFYRSKREQRTRRRNGAINGIGLAVVGSPFLVLGGVMDDMQALAYVGATMFVGGLAWFYKSMICIVNSEEQLTQAVLDYSHALDSLNLDEEAEYALESRLRDNYEQRAA